MNCESCDEPKNSRTAAVTGFGVDQVARHRGEHVLLNGHLLLDRPLHAFEADAELILEQLADRTHAAVAEVIDVVLAVSARCLASSGAGN